MRDEGPVSGTPHVERLHCCAAELLRQVTCPAMTRLGQGSGGDICALCGALIRDSDVEYEAVLVSLDNSGTMTRFISSAIRSGTANAIARAGDIAPSRALPGENADPKVVSHQQHLRRSMGVEQVA